MVYSSRSKIDEVIHEFPFLAGRRTDGRISVR